MKTLTRLNGRAFTLAVAALAIAALCAMVGCSSSDSTTDPASGEAIDTTEAAEAPVENAEEAPAEPDVPTEYKSALTKAQQYNDTMYMSKAGLYNQLTSEYGEQFTAEAAQYAIDNVKADWNANALKKAQSYQETMSMSPSAIHDQLVSEYGEQFTVEEADYAIANLS